MADWVLLAVDFGLVVLVWLVQLVVYPSFRVVAPAEFESWHAAYGRRVSIIVIPLMLGQVALHGFQLVEGASIPALGSALGIGVAWLVTFRIAVPCHRKLGEVGKSDAVIHRLVRANGWRTAAWSFAFACSVLALA